MEKKWFLLKWYLYGAKALAKEIELGSTGRYASIPGIPKLEIEKIRLESLRLNTVNASSVSIDQHAYATDSPIKPKKMPVIAVAFIMGLALSSFLVFITSNVLFFEQ